jgi:hypothetical protein
MFTGDPPFVSIFTNHPLVHILWFLDDDKGQRETILSEVNTDGQLMHSTLWGKVKMALFVLSHGVKSVIYRRVAAPTSLREVK